MLIIAAQADLAKGLSNVSHALTAKSPIAALDCVLIRVYENYIRLTCSDMHITIHADVPARCEAGGQFLLPGRLFTEIIKKMPDGDVTIDVDARLAVKLSARSTRTTLTAIPADTYPELPPEPTQVQNALISAAALKDMIRKTTFAAAVDDVRPVLTGCLCKVESGKFTMVGLDSFRMAVARAPLGETGNFSYIVPARYLNDLSRILPEEDDLLTLAFGDGSMGLKVGSVEILIRLMEGTYVQYEKIIPADNQTRVVLPKSQLSGCVERASLIAREGKSNLIRMQVEENQVIVTSNSDTGDLYETIPCQTVGPNLTIAFNIRYVADVLRSVSDENITLLFNTPVSPCTIVPEEGDAFLYLVLPVRTH